MITGGAGFVGSNLAIQLRSQYPQVSILAVDNLVRRGSELNLPFLKGAGVEFVHADVRITDDLVDLPEADVIVDASADPSVLSGIQNSTSKLVQSNLIGTINLLDRAVAHKSKFIFLSTSRVYPYDKLNQIVLDEESQRFVVNEKQNLSGISKQGISEEFTLPGVRSFYGAAKLSSELFINEYAAFKGLEAVILRCGVIAGPGQFGKVDQGVLVFWLAMHFWKKKLSYFGYGGAGKQVRDMLHVHDLTALIDQILGDFGVFKNRTFNAGGGMMNSVSLAELTSLCSDITGNVINIGSVTDDRVADVPYYVTDYSLLSSLCDWKPQKNLQSLVEDTFQWMKKNEHQLKNILV
jgi:CDP-paratose 2-epimerase